MIKYANLGGDKQLNEIVMAGSHDAGINQGGNNAKTQALDILGQANAGVRFFDIRVAAFAAGEVKGEKMVELKSFHADDMVHKKEKKSRLMYGFEGKQDITRSKLKAGVEGLTLNKILNDAKSFVESGDGSGEFLILKFDKCTNWEYIAETCRNVLGNKIYSDGGNINTKKLSDLAGRVIVAFMTPGYSALKFPPHRAGITHIKNLYKPPAGYDQNFDGLQYWGAGGTGINNNNFDQKIRENISTQGKILKSASTGVAPKLTRFTRKVKVAGCSAANPNALGMMYLTTTGVFKSIKSRNDLMWDQGHRWGLANIWNNGFEEYIRNALPDHNDPGSYSSGGTLKLFMPNIVMIDFADPQKCEHIYSLNLMAAVKLAQVCKKLGV